MKKILLIATGGTIASKPTDSGLAPQITSEEIISCVPEIASLCHVSTLQLCNLDSTNLNCDHWLAMARCLEDHYDDFDGFVCVGVVLVEGDEDLPVCEGGAELE